MERGAQALRPPRDAPGFAATGALPKDGEQAVVGADEVAPRDARDDGFAAAADAGIDDSQKNGVEGILGSERGEKVRGRRDAEGRRVVQRVEDRCARCARREDCLYLADVEVGGAEVGEEDEGPGARQAAAFFSLFFSGFLSVAFFSLFCSSPVAASSPARSVSMTRASGALSPLRKPIFRMRV